MKVTEDRMSGASIPFVEGSTQEYERALDGLPKLLRPRRRNRKLEWVRTVLLCALLLVGLLYVLPLMPLTNR